MVDGVKAYFGSANLTGAGMGAKSKKKRNFENGILTDDPALVEPLVEPVIAKRGLLFGGAAGLSIFENQIGSIGNNEYGVYQFVCFLWRISTGSYEGHAWR